MTVSFQPFSYGSGSLSLLILQVRADGGVAPDGAVGVLLQISDSEGPGRQESMR